MLLPLLAFATRLECLFVGGPGRGRTASAILMSVLAGYPVREVRRAMQHGHPQMTIADLLGNPLPADLISAQSVDAIRIAWRPWLGVRVKIVDEYNRIPTRTQSEGMGRYRIGRSVDGVQVDGELNGERVYNECKTATRHSRGAQGCLRNASHG